MSKIIEGFWDVISVVKKLFGHGMILVLIAEREEIPIPSIRC